MKDAIFYTFSTIPQVLAGAIALIGVFAIYKIREMKLELFGFSQNIISNLKFLPPKVLNGVKEAQISRDLLIINDHFDTLIEIAEYQDLKDTIDKYVPNEPDGKNLSERQEAIKKQIENGEITLPYNMELENAKIYINSFRKLYLKVSKIRKRTIFATIFTATLIFLSIITIPYTCYLMQVNWLDLFFVVWFSLVAFSLFLLVRLIKTSL